MKVRKFHQFSYIEKGIINSVIIDFFTGNIFHVDNETLEHFENGNFKEIPDFIRKIKKEELIIEIDSGTWIPYLNFRKELDAEIDDNSFSLEVEAGAPLEAVKKKFENGKILSVIFFGNKKPKGFFQRNNIILKKKNFLKCLEMVKTDGEFGKIDRETYQFNMLYNSCWGKKIAVTKDGKIRPCIYSEIIIGDLSQDSLKEILNKASFYWTLTKDKIEKCKICEFRYICFDCREIAYKKFGKILSTNPFCDYCPEAGKFE